MKSHPLPFGEKSSDFAGLFNLIKALNSSIKWENLLLIEVATTSKDLRKAKSLKEIELKVIYLV